MQILALTGQFVLLPLALGIHGKLEGAQFLRDGDGLGTCGFLGFGAIAGPSIAGHVYQAAGLPTMLATAGLTILDAEDTEFEREVLEEYLLSAPNDVTKLTGAVKAGNRFRVSRTEG